MRKLLILPLLWLCLTGTTYRDIAASSYIVAAGVTNNTNWTVVLRVDLDGSTGEQRALTSSVALTRFAQIFFNGGGADQAACRAWDGALKTVTQTSAGVTNFHTYVCTGSNGAPVSFWIDNTKIGDSANLGTQAYIAPGNTHIGAARDGTLTTPGNYSVAKVYGRRISTNEVSWESLGVINAIYGNQEVFLLNMDTSNENLAGTGDASSTGTHAAVAGNQPPLMWAGGAV